MEQLDFPFFCDQDKLRAFVTQQCAIEDEHDRLRDELRLLKELYVDDFPMRAALTAIKVVRARRKLAEHHKEPMSYTHQEALERLVAQHLDTLDAERQVPDMT